MSTKSFDMKSEYTTDTEDDSEIEYDISKNLLNRRKRSFIHDKSDDENNVNDCKKKILKSYSKNALNARANRLKKKRYMEDLEREVLKLRSDNGKLKSILSNQSFVIENLRKEVRYVKNVLANNSDITKLLKAINGSTGMPATTSLNKDLTILNDFHLKNDPTNMSSPDSNYDNMDLLSDEEFLKPLESDVLFSNYDIPLIEDGPMLGEDDPFTIKSTLTEHNYTISSNEYSDDGGICLHVSNGKVSLEFCSKCQENSTETWKELDTN